MVMVAAVGLLSSCAATPKNRTVGRQLPTLASVSGGRFLSRVELDNGDLVVDPAGKSKPGISATTAQALFRATDVVDGAYRFAVLGLGRVTISPAVSASSTTTTGPGTTTTTTTIGAPGPTTGAGATSTTHATTTTATTAATTTTNPTTSTGASAEPGSTGATVPTSTSAPALPRYHDRLAWVGIAWGADCPARASTSRLATRYVAVILDADTGHSALAYTSRSATACSGPVQAPSVIRPDELVSVPWQPVGPTSTSVRVTMPACSTYFGWTDVPGTGAASVQVVARKPFDPACGSDAAGVVVVGDVVPLGSAQSQVSHAALGPVDALRTLPGG
jgi:hypothetical protein